MTFKAHNLMKKFTTIPTASSSGRELDAKAGEQRRRGPRESGGTLGAVTETSEGDGGQGGAAPSATAGREYCKRASQTQTGEAYHPCQTRLLSDANAGLITPASQPRVTIQSRTGNLFVVQHHLNLGRDLDDVLVLCLNRNALIRPLVYVCLPRTQKCDQASER